MSTADRERLVVLAQGWTVVVYSERSLRLSVSDRHRGVMGATESVERRTLKRLLWMRPLGFPAPLHTSQPCKPRSLVTSQVQER